LFVYFIEDPLVILSINSGILGIILVKQDVEICEVGTKWGSRKWWGDMGEEIWEFLGFVAIVCVWVNFWCCTVGCLGQGLQGLGLYNVGTVGSSVDGECVGGRGSMVRCWGG
jgi:hypothetical protein